MYICWFPAVLSVPQRGARVCTPGGNAYPAEPLVLAGVDGILINFHQTKAITGRGHSERRLKRVFSFHWERKLNVQECQDSSVFSPLLWPVSLFPRLFSLSSSSVFTFIDIHATGFFLRGTGKDSDTSWLLVSFQSVQWVSNETLVTYSCNAQNCRKNITQAQHKTI